MSSQLPSSNPTAHVGVKETHPPQLWFRNRMPLTSDYQNYDVGDCWIDPTDKQFFFLVKKLQGVATWVSGGGNLFAVQTLTPDSGGAVSPIANNINVNGGPNVQTSAGVPGQLIITAMGFASFTWVGVAGAAQTLAPNTGYYVLNAGLVTFTLPALCAAGTIMRVATTGLGTWQIVCNGGQIIGGAGTSTSVGGTLSSNTNNDSVELLCTLANSTWVIISGMGNWNFV